MRRTLPWVGMRVIELEKGDGVGKVADLLFDRNHRASVLLIDREGVLTGRGAILFADIDSFGEDAVTIESPEFVGDLEWTEGGLYLITGDNPLVGKEILTEDGNLLGTVADVYIGGETDNIVGYEVSDGLLADLVTGRKWLPYSDTLQIGEQIIVRQTAKLSDLQTHT
ncbi:PRC-barrel domain-containing protein [Effusibacillus lacus]|uniref:Photosystem reaction center subunit H n=1 Tax=Effusibacillus lacus TaxID=1348429 RepID=A0A292YPB4_9BACL|nr:PRC-barrel domain-containing protein [Effusibacillus lacus]GAX90320.1 photosystem reaction center subunit H [Effusibacillus lacus]